MYREYAPRAGPDARAPRTRKARTDPLRIPRIGPLEILIVLILLSYIPALIVAGMKGRWVWFTLGILLWLPAFVGALLPPKPNSSWALRRGARRG